jgi:poly(3-hydroxyalkanoate) synthetase
MESTVSFSIDGKRHAWIKPSWKGEPGRWLVWRQKENGSLGLVTAFWRKRSAEKAVIAYERDGTMKGFIF